MKKILIAAGALILGAASALASDAHVHKTVQPETLKWVAPAAYAKGAQFTVVTGDPTKEGFYVVRLKVPAGFRIAPHTHPNDENVTVLSGTFGIGTGATFDEKKGSTVKAGGYAFVAKGMHHFAWFPEETVIQLHGMGPQGITYINAADDPRKTN